MMRQKGYRRRASFLAFLVLMGSGLVNAKPCSIKIKSVKGHFLAQFPEQPGACEYQVDGCTNLMVGSWGGASESDTVSSGGDGEIVVPLNVTGRTRFFRIRAVPLPPLLPTPSNMVRVASGVVERGNVPGDEEGPVYPGSVVNATLRGGDEMVCTHVSADFFIDPTETTKASWDAVTAWATNNGYVFAGTESAVGPNHPVQGITWHDCLKWANARSQMEGLDPCYRNPDGSIYISNLTFSGSCDWRANGYRLPTEAEWEWAARGGESGHRFPWSDVETIDHSRANYRAGPDRYDYDVATESGYHPDAISDHFPYTLPVGTFAPNAYGLYDMAGNVYEWCWDFYAPDSYAVTPATALPRGPASGELRVARGGCWRSTARTCRVANRHAFYPGLSSQAIGFRLVRRAR